MKKKVIIIILILIVLLAAAFFIVKFTMGVTMAEAQDIALQHTGISLNDVEFTKLKLDDFEYEIEFVTSDAVYDYEISSLTGKILKFEKSMKNNSFIIE